MYKTEETGQISMEPEMLQTEDAKEAEYLRKCLVDISTMIFDTAEKLSTVNYCLLLRRLKDNISAEEIFVSAIAAAQERKRKVDFSDE